MKLLIAGELAAGGLAWSLQPGFAENADIVMVDLYGSTSGSIDRHTFSARAARSVARRASGKRLIESVQQHRPDWVVLVKGRGVDDAIPAVREMGVRVACYFPDNPFWNLGDPGAIARLRACDIAIVWSNRIAHDLRHEGVRTAVVPFGYDDRWYPLGDPDAPRSGIVFLGTWSPRRERYLAALNGLDLTVHGTGWGNSTTVVGGPPTYERDAGSLLRKAALGINLLHPQCSGAHNMRTREIAASGAVQLCDPGSDGTPFLDGLDCVWFRSPAELRAHAEELLGQPRYGVELARRANALVASEHYRLRSRQIVACLGAA